MPFSTGSLSAGTPSADLVAALDAILPGQGWVFVETTVQNTITWRIWRNPGTNNTSGLDFFIGFGFNAATATNPLYGFVAETYSTATKAVTRYVPSRNTAAVFPAATYPIQADGSHTGSAVTPGTNAWNTNASGMASVAGVATPGSGFYWISCTRDRLIWATSALDAAYLGLFDTALGAADPLPLCQSPMTVEYNASVNVALIGSVGAVQYTREINGAGLTYGVASDFPFAAGQAPGSEYAPLDFYNGSRSVGARPEIISHAQTGTSGILSRPRRGRLKDVLQFSAGTANGDTVDVSVGGVTTTYVRMCRSASSPLGLFVPNNV